MSFPLLLPGIYAYKRIAVLFNQLIRVVRYLSCECLIIVLGTVVLPVYGATAAEGSIQATTKTDQAGNTPPDKNLYSITALHQSSESRNLPPPFTGIDGNCPDNAVPKEKIDLVEAVTRALCNDPRTRQSWADIVSQAAQVGVEQAAYLPAVNASLRGGPDHLWQNDKAASDSDLAGSINGSTNNASLDFTWTLFDFGQRAASVESARQTLLAVTAVHDTTVQAVFLEAASAYYTLIAAQSAVANAKEVLQFNQNSLADAEARANTDGAMDKSEKLQAQSSAEQAALDLNSAEGDLKNAQGQLAVLLGFSPTTELSLDDSEASKPNEKLDRSIDQLLAQALAAHPEIREAQSRVSVASANVDSARRTNRPTINMIQGNDWERDIWGGKQWENKLLLQMSIPLFDGSRRYRKQAALAELDSAREDVFSARQKIALEVWISYQSLKTQSAAIERTTHLLDTAIKLLKSEKDLYKSGDGDMLDLLYAQQTVADASQSRLEALTGWRVARLRLAASLGQLGFWTIQKPSNDK